MSTTICAYGFVFQHDALVSASRCLEKFKRLFWRPVGFVHIPVNAMGAGPAEDPPQEAGEEEQEAFRPRLSR